MHNTPHTEETKRKISLAKIGKSSYNKGKKNPKGSIAKMGSKNPMYGTKQSKETIEKRFKNSRGEKHYEWKGEDAGYDAKHTFTLRHYGNPEVCEDCGLQGSKVNGRWNIDWSNVDHKYRRVFEDYTGRCRNCHAKYDVKNNLRKPKYGKPQQ